MAEATPVWVAALGLPVVVGRSGPGKPTQPVCLVRRALDSPSRHCYSYRVLPKPSKSPRFRGGQMEFLAVLGDSGHGTQV
jgi:hypothetical protein